MRIQPARSNLLSKRGLTAAGMMTYAEAAVRSGASIYQIGHHDGPKGVNEDALVPTAKILSPDQTSKSSSLSSCALQRPVRRRHRSTASRLAAATVARFLVRLSVAARTFKKGG